MKRPVQCAGQQQSSSNFTKYCAYSTLLYLLFSTLIYSSLLFSSALLFCSPLLYYSLLFSTLLYSTLLFSTLLFSTLLFSTILHYSLLFLKLRNSEASHPNFLWKTCRLDLPTQFCVLGEGLTDRFVPTLSCFQLHPSIQVISWEVWPQISVWLGKPPLPGCKLVPNEGLDDLNWDPRSKTCPDYRCLQKIKAFLPARRRTPRTITKEWEGNADTFWLWFRSRCHCGGWCDDRVGFENVVALLGTGSLHIGFDYMWFKIKDHWVIPPS